MAYLEKSQRRNSEVGYVGLKEGLASIQQDQEKIR
jgi:hypothetical protein